MLEKIFENSLWQSRFVIMLAVVFGLLSALILFIVASLDVWGCAVYTFKTLAAGLHPDDFHANILSAIIGAVDLYLIGVVMLLFSFGLYELFISEIDAAKCEEGCDNKVLAIHSLDQLKDKISKVIIMVLVVGFFQKVLHTEFKTALEMFYFALSICALAVGLFFLGKVGKK